MSRLLIHCNRLFKSFGEHALFKGISLSLHQGERFALIGENGAGKTTLLEILAGIQLPDAGLMEKAKDLTIGFLPQEVTLSDEKITAREVILSGPLTELEKELKSLEPHLDDPASLALWSDLHEKYEKHGGYQRPAVEEILHRLKLKIDLDVPMKSLSSGQKVRVLLAKMLFESPDVLLLDEPTNHLDQEMTLWLENLLLNYRGSLIIVSHDRKFLNASCNRLLEVHSGHLTAYGGSYDFYLQEREKRIEREIKAYELQKEEKAELKEKIRSMTFSKRASKERSDNDKLSYNQRGEGQQKSVKRTLENLKARLKEIEDHPLLHPRPKTITGLVFAKTPLSSPIALELEDVSKSFSSKPILNHISFTLHKGDRIIITGANGSGKTTLLALIAGKLAPDSGSIRIPPTGSIAYLDQETSHFPLDETPKEFFARHFKLNEEDLCRELYRAGLGGMEFINRPFASLSVGQRKRLSLLSLILLKPNILLLDEPTNHLDFITLEALEKALLDFEGAILAISHDSTFIEKIASEVWSLNEGKLKISETQ